MEEDGCGCAIINFIGTAFVVAIFIRLVMLFLGL